MNEFIDPDKLKSRGHQPGACNLIEWRCLVIHMAQQRIWHLKDYYAGSEWQLGRADL